MDLVINSNSSNFLRNLNLNNLIMTLAHSQMLVVFKYSGNPLQTLKERGKLLLLTVFLEGNRLHMEWKMDKRRTNIEEMSI